MTARTPVLSAWQQLRNQSINCEQALKNLVDDQKILNLKLLDRVAIKVMSNMDIAESHRPQDGRIGENYVSGKDLEVALDMRVSTLPCVGGEKAVIRLLPQENPFSGLQDLGFSETTLNIYKSWLCQPQGMIIFTGPTGSGKTSTLYNSLLAVATENVKTDSWRKGRGCSNCFNSGYSGREAIVELLAVDDRIREIIYEGTLTELHRYLHETGFLSFRIAAIEKVTTGATTVEEIQRVLPRSSLARKFSI